MGHYPVRPGLSHHGEDRGVPSPYPKMGIPLQHLYRFERGRIVEVGDAERITEEDVELLTAFDGSQVLDQEVSQLEHDDGVYDDLLAFLQALFDPFRDAGMLWGVAIEVVGPDVGVNREDGSHPICS